MHVERLEFIHIHVIKLVEKGFFFKFAKRYASVPVRGS